MDKKLGPCTICRRLPCTCLPKTKDEIFEAVMDELQQVWTDNILKLAELHQKPVGIRSTQIASLVRLLIDKNILR